MAKLFSMVMGVSLMLVVLACAPKAAPVAAPAPATPQAASSLPVPVAPVISAEETAWQKVVEAAKKEGTVTVYSWSFVGDIGIALSRAFENRYGIKMNIITGRASEFVERLKTEQRTGQRVGDVFEGGEAGAFNLKDAGLLLATKDLPVLREKVWVVDPLTLDPEGYMLGTGLGVTSPFVNTNLVKPGEEPQSLLDFLQPRWKGQMMTADPNMSSIPYYLLTYVRRNIVDMDYMRSLGKQDLRFIVNISEALRLLSQGAAPLVLGGDSTVASPFVSQGAPIRALGVREGVLARMYVISAVKSSPRPNAARVWANWMLTQEGQQASAKAREATPIRRDVLDYTPKGAQLEGAKLLVMTAEDVAEAARFQREKFLVTTWGK